MASTSSQSELPAILFDCLLKAEVGQPAPTAPSDEKEQCEGPRDPFNYSIFFHNWFRTEGRAVFFLFKKNLKVTNLQFAELLSLIRSHISNEEGHPLDIQFVSPADFESTIRNTMETFRRDPNDPQHRYAELSRLYCDLLRRIIVVDSFFGSCAVFLPPKTELPLLPICAQSGYVHSCGDVVYIRNTYKATGDEFIKRVAAHLNGPQRPRARIPFRIYCHEDFTPFDRRFDKSLQAGLDDVKIHLGKVYMGGASVLSVLEDLQAAQGDKLIIPPPGDYRGAEEFLEDFPDRDGSRCLFFIIDHGIGDRPQVPSQRRYFICYEQMYINESPFHIFDENKPAWIAHTTIPHTLMGAMLNLTRPFWPTTGGPVKICDPFVGTGTTWLETIKYAPRVSATCADKSSIAALMASDNLQFFCSDVTALEQTKSFLEGVLQIPWDEDYQIAFEFPEMSPSVRKVFSEVLRYHTALQRADRNMPDPDLDTLLTFTSRERILFYVLRRASVRHAPSLARGAESLREAFTQEGAVMLEQVKELINLRRREQHIVDDNPSRYYYPAIRIFRGTYSNAVSIDVQSGVDSLRSESILNSVQPSDVIETLRAGGFDVIIADPPYGFNTAADAVKLADLYDRFISASVQALNESGQLVISLPDWSHTGRHLPYFALKQIVTQQVLIAAEADRREVVQSAFALPGSALIYRAPYYWESERALRRAVLHFRLRKRRFVRK